MKDLRTIIAQHPFLLGMTPEHLEIIARHARAVEFNLGQVIVRESDAAYEFFLLLDGEVAVESYIPRADNLPLQTLGVGEVLGWSWLFPPFTWHFQARAVAPTKAVLVDGARLLLACEKDFDFGFEMMRRIAHVVTKRLQITRKLLVEMSSTIGSLAPFEEAFSHHDAPAVAGKLPELLAEHPFVKGVKPDHFKVLLDCAMERDFAAGEEIFGEGEVANRFYLIQRGKVILEASTAGTKVPIQVISDGDVLGWSWLFEPFYWRFDARAITPTKSIFLFGTRLREHCEADHQFGCELMKRAARVLIQRLQATRKQLLAARESITRSQAKA